MESKYEDEDESKFGENKDSGGDSEEEEAEVEREFKVRAYSMSEASRKGGLIREHLVAWRRRHPIMTNSLLDWQLRALPVDDTGVAHHPFEGGDCR